MITAGAVFGRNRWKHAVVLILLLGVGSTPLLAKGKTEKVNEPSEHASGLAAGQRDARGSGVWVLSGLNLGPTRLILPWVIGTEVPGGNLVGKSAVYVGGYVDEYQSKAKPKHFSYSLVGVAVTSSSFNEEECASCCPSFSEEKCAAGCAEAGLGVGLGAIEGCGSVVGQLQVQGCVR